MTAPFIPNDGCINGRRVRTIQTEGGSSYDVDSDILISQSKYFKAVFDYDSEKCVFIGGIDSDIMKEILYYLEKGNMILSESNVFNILKAADLCWMLDAILREVLSVLSKLITPLNCIKFYNEALMLEHLNIPSLCYCYIQTHFESVVKIADIGDMPFDHLKRLLTDKDLCVKNETTVWRAIMKWIDRDCENRKEHAPDLLLCVRLLEICTDEFVRKLTIHPLVTQNEVLSGIVTHVSTLSETSLKAQFIDAISKLSSESVPFGPRQERLKLEIIKRCEQPTFGEVDLVIATDDKGKARRTKIAEKGFTFVSSLFTFNCKLKVYIFETMLFGRRCIFDLLTGSWTDARPPVKLASSIFFVEVTSLVYAVWFDIEYRTEKIAYFDPESNKWTEVASFAVSDTEYLDTSSATAHGGLIYITMFYNYPYPRRRFGMSYDPVFDAWAEFVPPKFEPPLIVSFNGSLLAISRQTTSVLEFHPEIGIWTKFQALPAAYKLAQAEVRGDFLFVYESLNLEEVRPVYWHLDGSEWRNASSIFDRTTVEFTCEDPDVVRKWHRHLMDIEWDAMSKEWGRGKISTETFS